MPFLDPFCLTLVRPAKGWLDRPVFKYSCNQTYRSVRFGLKITIPAGYQTDLNSTPRFPVAYWLLGEVGAQEAGLHDFMYGTGIVSREAADQIFYDALEEAGIGLSRRWLIWKGVRLRGASHYVNGEPETAAPNSEAEAIDETRRG